MKHHIDYVSTKEAADLTGYHSDYVARLCREGKIQARQDGRVWQLSRTSLLAFVDEQARNKKRHVAMLAHKRGQEYRRSLRSLKYESAAPYSPRTTSTKMSNRGEVFQVASAMTITAVVMVSGFYGAQSVLFSTGLTQGVSILSDMHEQALALLPDSNYGIDSSLPKSYVFALQDPFEHLILNMPARTFSAASALHGVSSDASATFAFVQSSPDMAPRTEIIQSAVVHHTDYSLIIGQVIAVLDPNYIVSQYVALVERAGEVTYATGISMRDIVNTVPADAARAGITLGDRIEYLVATAVVTAPYVYTDSIDAFVARVPQVLESSLKVQIALGEAVLGLREVIAIPDHRTAIASPAALVSGWTTPLMTFIAESISFWSSKTLGATSVRSSVRSSVVWSGILTEAAISEVQKANDSTHRASRAFSIKDTRVSAQMLNRLSDSTVASLSGVHIQHLTESKETQYSLVMTGLSSTLLYANSVSVIAQTSVHAPLTFASGSLSVGTVVSNGNIPGLVSTNANAQTDLPKTYRDAIETPLGTGIAYDARLTDEPVSSWLSTKTVLLMRINPRALSSGVRGQGFVVHGSITNDGVTEKTMQDAQGTLVARLGNGAGLNPIASADATSSAQGGRHQYTYSNYVLRGPSQLTKIGSSASLSRATTEPPTTPDRTMLVSREKITHSLLVSDTRFTSFGASNSVATATLGEGAHESVRSLSMKYTPQQAPVTPLEDDIAYLVPVYKNLTQYAE